MSIRNQENSLAVNTVPFTVVACTFIQEPVVWTCRIRRRSIPMRYPTKPLSVESFGSYRVFFLSRLSYLISRRWSDLDNAPLPVMDRIRSALDPRELRYLFFADATGFRIPNQIFFDQNRT